jgi:hypothetical protein
MRPSRRTNEQNHLEKTMKKYFAIAFVLGVIAFASVSFLAQAEQQAEQQADQPAEEAAAPDPVVSGSDPSEGEAAADNATMMMPVDGKFDADDQECAGSSAQPDPKTGEQPDEVKQAKLYKKCMLGKGHSQVDLKARANAEAPPAE